MKTSPQIVYQLLPISHTSSTTTESAIAINCSIELATTAYRTRDAIPMTRFGHFGTFPSHVSPNPTSTLNRIFSFGFRTESSRTFRTFSAFATTTCNASSRCSAGTTPACSQSSVVDRSVEEGSKPPSPKSSDFWRENQKMTRREGGPENARNHLEGTLCDRFIGMSESDVEKAGNEVGRSDDFGE